MDYKVLVLAMLASVQALYYDDGVCLYDCNSPRLLTPTMTDTAPVPDIYGAGQCTCENFKMETLRYYSLDFFPLVLAVIIIILSKTKPSRSCKTIQLILVHLMCFIPLTTQSDDDTRVSKLLNRASCRAMPYPVAMDRNRANVANPAVVGPNPAVVGPNPAVVGPNPAVDGPVGPNPAVEGPVEPNLAVIGPNPAVIEPDLEDIEPNLAVIGPNPAVIEPDLEDIEPNLDVIENNPVIIEPNPVVIEPNQEVGEASSSNIRRPSTDVVYGDIAPDGTSDTSSRAGNFSDFEDTDHSEEEAVWAEMVERIRRPDEDDEFGNNGRRRHCERTG